MVACALLIYQRLKNNLVLFFLLVLFNAANTTYIVRYSTTRQFTFIVFFGGGAHSCNLPEARDKNLITFGQLSKEKIRVESLGMEH